LDRVPSEHIFLHKLLHAQESDQKPSTSHASDNDERQHLEAALRSRKGTTKRTLEQIIAAIDHERERNEELAAVVRQRVSTEGRVVILIALLFQGQICHVIKGGKAI
jgi:hypothetical protein